MGKNINSPRGFALPVKSQQLVRNAALFTVSLLVGLLLAEALVRITGAAPQVSVVQRGRFQLSSNPLIGYELRPSFRYEGSLQTKLYDFTGVSNSFGFRDREHTLRKPEGTYRILVLGDSITQGLCIEEEEHVFTRVLERSLRGHEVPVEVLNFGVSGYNTQQEVETLREKGLKFSPDLVIIAYCINDKNGMERGILEPLLEQGKTQGTASSHLRFSWLHRSALYRLLRYRLVPELFERETGEALSAYYAANENSVGDQFRKLSFLGLANGFDVLVVMFPEFRNLKQYEFADMHERIRRLAQQNGFRFLDLLPTFQQCAEKRRVDLDHLHPNVFGHRCAGRAIANYVRTRLLLAGQP